jgi:hypothetical protein
MILGNPSDSKAETFEKKKKNNSKLEVFLFGLAWQDRIIPWSAALPAAHHTSTYVCRILAKVEERTAGDPDRTG